MLKQIKLLADTHFTHLLGSLQYGHYFFSFNKADLRILKELQQIVVDEINQQEND